MKSVIVVASVATFCLCDCAVQPIENQYGRTGVRPEEWAEIRVAIHSITSSPVTYCSRVPEPKPAYQLDEITVDTADGKHYWARKIRGKWQFHEVIVVGHVAPSSNQTLQPTAGRRTSLLFV
jgi:hypothetical protein